MSANPDFSDLFSTLNAESVEYLVIGAHAVMYYTEPRFTKDIDVWVRPTRENAERVCRALARFGAPMMDVTLEDFTNPDLIYQIGVAPNRVDLMMGIVGVEFEEAWAGRVDSTYGDVPIHLIGKAELIRAKQASGRPQDLLDLDRLSLSQL
jgi:hypothetical protein